ncbi:unnamed protein product [Prorocentrum cordatum]|uniref:Uncharacterized protein n=1 Tax=Prorocentrum cordatum TaxID=2364126 RepID=A0ABN9UTE9_9DINO|nr:unnamed protein product [Polarella glacialis]
MLATCSGVSSRTTRRSASRSACRTTFARSTGRITFARFPVCLALTRSPRTPTWRPRWSTVIEQSGGGPTKNENDASILQNLLGYCITNDAQQTTEQVLEAVPATLVVEQSGGVTKNEDDYDTKPCDPVVMQGDLQDNAPQTPQTNQIKQSRTHTAASSLQSPAARFLRW